MTHPTLSLEADLAAIQRWLATAQTLFGQLA
jgi:hypothetical protein